MGYKLQRPGAIVEDPLFRGSDVIVRYKVPDVMTSQEVKKLAIWASKNDDRAIEMLPKVVGLVVESLKGIEMDGLDGDEYVFEKTKAGHVTEASMGPVIPLGVDLQNFVLEKAGVMSGADAKNS